MPIQRHERNRFYHLPVYCGYCGQGVLSVDEAEPRMEPCKHTLFIAHDEGFEYLSGRAEAQLQTQGYAVTRHDDGVIEVSSAEESGLSSPDEITDGIDFPDAIKVAAYVGPPSGFGSYVGLAPCDDE